MASGRKRTFNENDVLQSAMEVFWAKGYVGSSLSDLTQSMGINKPSMYSTFGNKEALFIRATEFYIENNAKSHLVLLNALNLPFAIRLKNYLMSIVSAQCKSKKGCYLAFCESELAGGELPNGAALILNKAASTTRKTLSNLFKQDPESIALQLNQQADIHALSLATVLKGTASMARSGISVHDLENVINVQLKGMGF